MQIYLCELIYYITSEYCKNVPQNKFDNYHALDPNLVSFSPESTYHVCRIVFLGNIKLNQEVGSFPFLYG